jgi:hypothetical protein
MGGGFALGHHANRRVAEVENGIQAQCRDDDHQALPNRHLIPQAEEDEDDRNKLASDAERSHDQERAQAEVCGDGASFSRKQADRQQ